LRVRIVEQRNSNYLKRFNIVFKWVWKGLQRDLERELQSYEDILAQRAKSKSSTRFGKVLIQIQRQLWSMVIKKSLECCVALWVEKQLLKEHQIIVGGELELDDYFMSIKVKGKKGRAKSYEEISRTKEFIKWRTQENLRLQKKELRCQELVRLTKGALYSIPEYQL